MGVAEFFQTARERHSIYMKRLVGQPPPWTSDPIFGRYKFTNVFRELDRTTAWFAENIRSHYVSRPESILATACFRWFNRTETGAAIAGDPLSEWISTGNTHPLLRAIATKAKPGGPYVTGAYIIKTPDGMPKLDGVMWALTEFWRSERRLGSHMVTPIEAGRILLAERGQWTLEEVHKYLADFPYLGGFMAYEIVSDLRWMHVLDQAPDICTWANPGPGAKRGLGLVFGDDIHRSASRGKMLGEMRQLLDASRQTENWPEEWPRWEMRETEHWSCEFAKYMKVVLGIGHPRGIYP